MKLKIIVLFVGVFGAFGLAGCKPRPTNLTGQVFIATQGGNSVKLGDVEILLLEKSQATDFIHRKQAVVESAITTRQQEATEAEMIAENA